MHGSSTLLGLPPVTAGLGTVSGPGGGARELDHATSWVSADAGNFLGVLDWFRDLQAYKACALHWVAAPLGQPSLAQPVQPCSACHPSDNHPESTRGSAPQLSPLPPTSAAPGRCTVTCVANKGAILRCIALAGWQHTDKCIVHQLFRPSFLRPTLGQATACTVSCSCRGHIAQYQLCAAALLCCTLHGQRS